MQQSTSKNVLRTIRIFQAIAIAYGLYVTIAFVILPRPATIRPQENGERTILFLGDSLTRGNVSASYVDELISRLKDEPIRLVNGGINGDHAHNLLTRVDGLLDEVPDPHMVFVLIGTNDANADLDPQEAERRIRSKNLPRSPGREVFKENLEILTLKLKERTDARIVLVSLPPIGEIPGDEPWEVADEYSQVVKTIAREQNLEYLPLGETLQTLITSEGPSPSEMPPYEHWYSKMGRAIARRKVLGQRYDTIGRSNGFLYHSDHLHLNEQGAAIMANLAEPLIREICLNSQVDLP